MNGNKDYLVYNIFKTVKDYKPSLTFIELYHELIERDVYISIEELHKTVATLLEEKKIVIEYLHHVLFKYPLITYKILDN